MTGKRFKQSRENCIDSVKKRKTTDRNTMIDWLNELSEENGELKHSNHRLAQNLIKSLDAIMKLEKENEQLKSEYKVLHTQYQDLKKFVENNFDEYLTQEKLNGQIIKLSDENEQLKQSFTMYYNLFVEFQKQMKGVKKASDLDSKDFEDLIELSKGNVFDDEIGWIHLPVKELKE